MSHYWKYQVAAGTLAVTYRPCIEFEHPLWKKLDRLTREWASAVLSSSAYERRSKLMVSNAIIGHTNCTKAEAEELTNLVLSQVVYLEDGERVKIKQIWSDAIAVDRHIKTTKGSNRNVFDRVQ